MILDNRPASTLNLVGGRLCLDFVNTVGNRSGGAFQDERLREYPDLLAWGIRTGILRRVQTDRILRKLRGSSSAASGTFKRAIAFREALHSILVSLLSGGDPGEDQMRLLNREVALARSHQLLQANSGGMAWTISGPEDALDSLLWPVALSASELLTTGDLTRLRECEADQCGWLFEDRSRNRSRHWCDMKECGNSAKVRRFRERRRRGIRK